jgi:hypothetical protein
VCRWNTSESNREKNGLIAETAVTAVKRSYDWSNLRISQYRKYSTRHLVASYNRSRVRN